MSKQFDRPLRATRHCRHYSYSRGLGEGPVCARGLDLTVPGSVRPCMPEPDCPCTLREDYTAEERATWEAWGEERKGRLITAIVALPRPIPLNTSGHVECPNCGGTLCYARWHRGAEIGCTTPFCCTARFSIEAGADWPMADREALQ